MIRKLRIKLQRLVAIAILVACAIIAAVTLYDRTPRPDNSLVEQLAPGAAGAIVRALGPSGLSRLSQVISAQNAFTWYSGGTHRASGTIHGQPYGLAFDILIDPARNPDSDTRLLRLQGIAAWHRGPGAPGGPAGEGPHIHCIWPGYISDNAENAQQISSFLHGWRALADRGRPVREWRDRSIRADEIAKVRQTYKDGDGDLLLRHVEPYDAVHRGAHSAATR